MTAARLGPLAAPITRTTVDRAALAAPSQVGLSFPLGASVVPGGAIGVLYAPTSGHDIAGFAQLEATGLPFRFFVCGPGGIGDPEGRLKHALDAAPDTFTLIRPDLYLAARLPNARAAGAETCLRKALCL